MRKELLNNIKIISELSILLMTALAFLSFLYTGIAAAGDGNVTDSSGNITLTSSPSGASIFVDSIYYGRTQTTQSILNLPQGAHTIELKLAGYEDYSQNISVSVGSSFFVTVDLRLLPSPTSPPITASISVLSIPSGATIYVDDTYRGETPKNISISAGYHDIELIHESYEPWINRIEIVSGKNDINPQLIPTKTPAPPPPRPSVSLAFDKSAGDLNKNGQFDEGDKLVITYGAYDDSGISSIKLIFDDNIVEVKYKMDTYTYTTNSLTKGNHSIVVEAVNSKGYNKLEKVSFIVVQGGPSVYSPKSRYEVTVGEDIPIVLAAINPIGNPTVKVQLIIKYPLNGVYSYESWCKGSEGVCTNEYSIQPGFSRSISVRMRADKADEYPLYTEVYYQFENDQKSATRYEQIVTLVVKPKSTPVPTFTQKPNPVSTPDKSGNGISPFLIIIGIGLILVLIFIRHFLKDDSPNEDQNDNL